LFGGGFFTGKERIMERTYCEKCEHFEAKQIAVRDLWRQLFLDKKLTEVKAEELELEEQAIIGELKDHQALEHDQDKVYEGQLTRDEVGTEPASSSL
jgi:hypothetical protein